MKEKVINFFVSKMVCFEVTANSKFEMVDHLFAYISNTSSSTYIAIIRVCVIYIYICYIVMQL